MLSCGPILAIDVREDVRPLLLDEARLLAVGLRLLVDALGLDALLDLADDDAIADDHLQRVDRRLRGQREDVDRFDPAIRRIVEPLRQAGACRRAGDGDLVVGAEPRCLDILAGHLAFEEQGAHLRVLDAQRRRFAGHGLECGQDEREVGDE